MFFAYPLPIIKSEGDGGGQRRGFVHFNLFTRSRSNDCVTKLFGAVILGLVRWISIALHP